MDLFKQADSCMCILCLPLTEDVRSLFHVEISGTDVERTRHASSDALISQPAPLPTESKLESDATNGHLCGTAEEPNEPGNDPVEPPGDTLTSLNVRPSIAATIRRELRNEKSYVIYAIGIAGVIFAAVGWILTLSLLST